MTQEIRGFMDRSLNDFTQACLVLIEEEEQQLAPNTALIAVLCDAVRLTREMAHMSERGIWPLRESLEALEARAFRPRTRWA
jgi:hypothetical protein